MGQRSGDNEARDSAPDGGAGGDAAKGKSGDTVDDTPVDARTGASGGDAGDGTGGGRLLSGRYRLGSVVGRGGMGTVWRATDEVLGRTVAVKELRIAAGVDDAERRHMITRTLREAKAIAAIRSQSVVTIYDMVDEGDRPWIVMELVEGRSLADIIRRDGPMDPRDAARIGLAILDVLRAAHAAGIVHRDVKPSNVLVAEENGRVVLTDFGIAKVEGDPSVTSTGMLVGAPSYISPERAKGEQPGPPADMWSLGALLYCCVEGRPPYDEGGALATLAAVMHNPIRPPRRAGALAEVVTGLLVKDPATRLTEPQARVLLREALTAEPGDAADPTLVVPLTEPGAGSPAEGIGPAAPRPRRPADRATPPAPGVPLPAAAAGGPAARRRTLIIAAVVAAVLLAVIGTAIATMRGGGGDSADDADGQGGGATNGTSPEPGDDPTAEDESPAGEATDGGEDEPDEDEADENEDEPDENGEGEDPPATEPGDDEGTGSSDAPSGYEVVTNEDFHFSIAMPEDWEALRGAGQNSGMIYGSPDDSAYKLQVDFNGSPGDDAEQAWRDLEGAVSGNSTDYQLLGIQSVEWRDYPSVADWQFQRTESGTRVRVLDRGFVVDGDHGYAIMITCPDDAWDDTRCTTLRETAFDTFEPLGQ
ncbi:serine/threonine-protein kinase [Streptomyces sp. RFCAC02]|uniref:serine/threonine-protein kinase n=1 Tax=Streptomyces sp. RFCAC02 TaxID=2499143 RepID=UPI0019D31681|nr:serine/threonine-protein kinase [Streptomyces sp. RFCAC02]